MLMEIRILLTLFKVKKRREEPPELKSELDVASPHGPRVAARRPLSRPEAQAKVRGPWLHTGAWLATSPTLSLPFLLQDSRGLKTTQPQFGAAPGPQRWELG